MTSPHQGPDVPQVPQDAGVAEARLIQTRVEKAGRLRARGVGPYPARFHRTHTTAQARALLEEAEKAAGGEGRSAQVSLGGRITARRGMGKAAFVDLQD